jgi:response regulator RpfG family c-di-GMP phosphodiesterase
VYGRIVAVADVFDALGADRCYKKAWPMDDILALFERERGQHFEPRLVDGLFRNLDQIIAIRDAYPDFSNE